MLIIPALGVHSEGLGVASGIPAPGRTYLSDSAPQCAATGDDITEPQGCSLTPLKADPSSPHCADEAGAQKSSVSSHSSGVLPGAVWVHPSPYLLVSSRDTTKLLSGRKGFSAGHGSVI